MASNPPSVEESLADPMMPKAGNKLVKNLHIIIPGLLIGALSLVLFSDAIEKDRVAGPKSLADQASAEINKTSNVSAPSSTSDIEQELNRQRTAPLPPVPTAGPEVPASLARGYDGTGLPPVPSGPGTVSAQNNAASEAELNRIKREEEIRSSALLALTGGAGKLGEVGEKSAPVGTPGDAVRKQRDEQLAQTNQMREELLRTVRGAAGGAPGAAPGIGGRPGVMPVGGSGANRNDSFLSGLAGQGASREVVKLDAPGPSPVIHQGVVIPAVLITEINSDLPGQISALVTMDVYDSVRGESKLIPKGSKLVGNYSNDITAGQERVMAGFTRLIRPDGSSVDLKAMQAADATGQSGLNDEVDNHFVKMFSTSFLVAGLAYLFESNQPDTVVVAGGGGNGASGLGSEAGQVLVDVSRSVLDRYKLIPPTLHIRKGHKFNVVVNKDISIPPYF